MVGVPVSLGASLLRRAAQEESPSSSAPPLRDRHFFLRYHFKPPDKDETGRVAAVPAAAVSLNGEIGEPGQDAAGPAKEENFAMDVGYQNVGVSTLEAPFQTAPDTFARTQTQQQQQTSARSAASSAAAASGAAAAPGSSFSHCAFIFDPATRTVRMELVDGTALEIRSKGLERDDAATRAMDQAADEARRVSEAAEKAGAGGAGKGRRGRGRGRGGSGSLRTRGPLSPAAPMSPPPVGVAGAAGAAKGGAEPPNERLLRRLEKVHAEADEFQAQHGKRVRIQRIRDRRKQRDLVAIRRRLQRRHRRRQRGDGDLSSSSGSSETTDGSSSPTEGDETESSDSD
jgi:hypothetical protein